MQRVWCPLSGEEEPGRILSSLSASQQESRHCAEADQEQQEAAGWAVGPPEQHYSLQEAAQFVSDRSPLPQRVSKTFRSSDHRTRLRDPRVVVAPTLNGAQSEASPDSSTEHFAGGDVLSTVQVNRLGGPGARAPLSLAEPRPSRCSSLALPHSNRLVLRRPARPVSSPCRQQNSCRYALQIKPKPVWDKGIGTAAWRNCRVGAVGVWSYLSISLVRVHP